MKKKSMTCLFIFSILVIFASNGLSQTECSVEWFAEDTTTQGDWYNNPVGSPIGVYGCYAHILPNPPSNRSEVPIGLFNTPVGFKIGDPSTWNKLASDPFNWTSSQYNALGSYRSIFPYWDEYMSCEPAVTYSVEGTNIPVISENQILINEEDGTEYTRAACWFAQNITFQPSNITKGKYLLSLYILDYDSIIRREKITVTLGSDSAEYDVISQFDQGLYVNFYLNIIELDSIIDISISKTAGANAVISGVFLSDYSGDSQTDNVAFVGTDDITQGDWDSTYGDVAFIKCAWNVPSTKTVYNFAKDYDHFWPADLNYSLTSGQQYAWTDESVKIDHVQYPIFEWAWESMKEVQSDPRAAFYLVGNCEEENSGNEGPGYRLACWDDGGERCKPFNGYMNFHLSFPEGEYLLSFYAYDQERTSRATQQYNIYAEDGTPLASRQVSGEIFDEGVYEIL